MANDFVYAISGFLCNYIKRYIDNIFSSDKSIWLYCIRVDNWLLSVLFGGKWLIQKIFKDKASSLIFCHHYNFVFFAVDDCPNVSWVKTFSMTQHNFYRVTMAAEGNVSGSSPKSSSAPAKLSCSSARRGCSDISA
jgi:hypothetical protein